MSDPVAVTEIPNLPGRRNDAHKGNTGRIFVVGGRLDEFGMAGAPALTAQASLKSGAGLVQVCTPSAVQPVIATLAPCATSRRLPDTGMIDLASMAGEFNADVIAIGPGLCPKIHDGEIYRLVKSFSKGVVIDADALNRLAELGDWNAVAPQNIVLTPHPGEMERLVKGWRVEVDLSDRTRTALAMSEATQAVVVLKGAGTVVAYGNRYYINQSGNSGMATAGSGDVLTGIISALIGQGMSPFDASCLGVYVHGLAGDIAAEEIGRLSMTASDILNFLSDAFCDLTGTDAVE